MTQEMKRNIVKAAPNRWLVFCILTLSGGIAFKLSSMKDMFYVPMQEFMGLTNTQIGGAMSMYGTVQTIGLIASSGWEPWAYISPPSRDTGAFWRPSA